jgi:hypothetical protein
MTQEYPMSKSKKSNVHPDHYTIAGRSRPGEDIIHEIETQEYAQAQQDITMHAPAAAPKLPRKARQRRPSRTRRAAGPRETKLSADGMAPIEESMP